MFLSILDVRLLLTAVLTISGYATYRILYYIIRPYFSPLRSIPGPPSPSFIYGNRRQITERLPEVQEQWVEEHGETLVWKFFFNDDRLQTLDLKANAHFLTRTDIYQRPETFRNFFNRLLGDGLLSAEGDAHRKQRRAMNPAFGQAQVNELSGIFLAKANELRDKIEGSLSDSALELSGTLEQPARLDMLSLLTKATLDIIGLAGFLYSFDALSATEEKPNELFNAFSILFQSLHKISIWNVLSTFIPILRWLPNPQNHVTSHAKSVMRRIGLELIKDKKASVRASTAAGEIEKAMIQDRDLLSLLVRANAAQDLPESQRLSDEDVLAQIPTFLLAGHETTSTGLSWALHALSLHSDIQTRLRAELRTVPLPRTYSTDPLSANQLSALNSLPLLDAVVRETLRLYSPVSGTSRTAVRDDVVPLEKPYKDRHGVLHDSIRISKGDTVFIPIAVLHRHVPLWGPDAKEFNPDRWLGSGPPAATAGIPGVYSHLLSFLGGPHACIGWRFSLLETKLILHVLISSFEFAPAATNVIQKSGIVSRPTLPAEPEKGTQLPLYVSRATLET